MIIKNRGSPCLRGDSLMANSTGEIFEARKEKIMAKKLLLIIIAGVFLGCTTTVGRQYDTTAINRIDLGKTTKSDAVSMLGVPASSKRLSNGIDLYYYAYGHSLPLDMGTTVDTLQLQIYDGVVINKWQRLAQY
jgi:hypothetical protein